MKSLGIVYTPLMAKREGRKKVKVKHEDRQIVANTDQDQELVYSCPKSDCDLVFQKGRDLLRHQITEDHFSNKYCVLCRKSFTRRFDLKRHIMSVHENIKFHCPYCVKVFNRLDSYKSHQVKAHGVYIPEDSIVSQGDDVDSLFK